MCICFHTQYLPTGSISIRTETPKVKKNISHRECSTEYMAVRPSTFATSVSWRELEMTETETWQTFEKIKQKKLSVQYASLYIKSWDLQIYAWHFFSMDLEEKMSACSVACFGEHVGKHLGLKAHYLSKQIPEKRRVPGKQRFWVTISHKHLSSASNNHFCSLLWWWPRWRLSHRWSGQLWMHKKSTLVLECLFLGWRGEGGASVPTVKKPNLM